MTYLFQVFKGCYFNVDNLNACSSHIMLRQSYHVLGLKLYLGDRINAAGGCRHPKEAEDSCIEVPAPVPYHVRGASEAVSFVSQSYSNLVPRRILMIGGRGQYS
jgi:hypothetical protein